MNACRYLGCVSTVYQSYHAQTVLYTGAGVRVYARRMAGQRAGARERIVATAYELFARRGIRDVGIDEVIARAEVSKASLYKYFRSKDDLVLAFLERREQLWTRDVLEQQSSRRGGTPEEQLLAIFDVFDDWFADDGFEGCSFINVLLEMRAGHPAGRAAITYLDNIRSMVGERARQAGLRDPDEFARCWHMLMTGSIVAAAEGDRHAATRAKTMARGLIESHRTEGCQPHDHVVNFYDTDDDLVDDVGQALADGLSAGEAVVVIATAAHRDSLAAKLIEHGIDLVAARDAGRYRALDAAETLAAFTVERALSQDRFVEVIGGVIAEAASAGRHVRAFGEMVALLWADGNVAGALELEAMWNDLARTVQFSLYCAYPMGIVSRAGDLVGMQQICAQHSAVVPAGS